MKCVLVDQVHMVHDKVTGKPRGYAFVEFEDEVDMHGKLKGIFSTLASLEKQNSNLVDSNGWQFCRKSRPVARTSLSPASVSMPVWVRQLSPRKPLCQVIMKFRKFSLVCQDMQVFVSF